MRLQMQRNVTKIVLLVISLGFLLIVILNGKPLILNMNVNRSTMGSKVTYFAPRTFGRIGNQLFVLAAMHSITRKTNKKPAQLIDDRFDDAIFETFEIDNPVVLTRNESNFVNHADFTGFKFNSVVLDFVRKNPERNISYFSQFGSYHNWIEHEAEVRRMFQFKSTFLKKCQTKLSETTKSSNVDPKNSLIIGIHARRGDFAVDEASAYSYVPADPNYIKKAIHMIIEGKLRTEMPKNSTFVILIFGDDPSWNKQFSEDLISSYEKQPSFNAPLIIVPNQNSPTMDMCLLTLCHHLVITTGTFGWWAAFLAGGDKMVIYQHVDDNAIFPTGEDFWMPHWIGIKSD